MRYSLARDGDQQLAFEGTELARATSAAAGKYRWTELVLYELSGGRYVVQTIAHTMYDRERTYYSATLYTDPGQMIYGLRDRKKKLLSKLALELLEVASEESLPILDALEDMEAETEEV